MEIKLCITKYFFNLRVSKMAKVFSLNTYPIVYRESRPSIYLRSRCTIVLFCFFLNLHHKVQVHNSSFNSFSARFFLEFDLNLLVLSSYAIWQENKTISVGFLIQNQCKSKYLGIWTQIISDLQNITVIIEKKSRL